MTPSKPEIILPLHIDNLLWGSGGEKPLSALKIVRLLVGLEYLIFVAYYVTFVLHVYYDTEEMWLLLIAGAAFVWFYHCLCGFGVGMMGKWLQAVRDREAVELWAYIALGLAPLSGAVYPLIAFYLFDDAFGLGFILLAPFAGFYLPFVLAVFWLRYHHREDQF